MQCNAYIGLEGSQTYTSLLEWFYLNSIRGTLPSTSGWFKFVLHFARKGWDVHIQFSKNYDTKYITISNNGLSRNVRISGHAPNPKKVKLNDSDYWIGPIKGRVPMSYSQIISEIERDLNIKSKAEILISLDNKSLLKELYNRLTNQLEKFIISERFAGIIRKSFNMLMPSINNLKRIDNTVDKGFNKSFYLNSLAFKTHIASYSDKSTKINNQPSIKDSSQREDIEDSSVEIVDYLNKDTSNPNILLTTEDRKVIRNKNKEKGKNKRSNYYMRSPDPNIKSCSICLSPISKGACEWKDCPLIKE